MTFNAKRVDLLKTDPRPVDDEGDLLIAAVQDLARENVHRRDCGQQLLLTKVRRNE